MGLKPNHAMIFNPKDGSLQLTECDFLIVDGVSRDAAMSGLAEFYTSNTDYKNGYEWLHFSEVTFGERPAGFSLCFHNGFLVSMHFGVSLPDDEDFMEWPTQETSERQVAFIRRVLKKQLGRSFTTGSESFKWGGMWASFDHRGFQASAGLNYASWKAD